MGKSKSLEKSDKQKPRRIDIIEAFNEQKAFSEKTACSMEELSLDMTLYQSRFDYLVENEVIFKIEFDEKKSLFFLDKEALEQLETKEDKEFFLKLVSIIIPGIIFLLLAIALL
ncbi:MAG: hypothetical protein U9O98_09380, partial [Asgard group archaeon]|nr:hypothetical protein [Asgard group archaeon]